MRGPAKYSRKGYRDAQPDGGAKDRARSRQIAAARQWSGLMGKLQRMIQAERAQKPQKRPQGGKAPAPGGNPPKAQGARQRPAQAPAGRPRRG